MFSCVFYEGKRVLEASVHWVTIPLPACHVTDNKIHQVSITNMEKTWDVVPAWVTVISIVVLVYYQEFTRECPRRFLRKK